MLRRRHIWALAGEQAGEFLGRPPDAAQGAQHLRDMFYRQGFNDRVITALSDVALLGDPAFVVEESAADKALFFKVFATVFYNLGNLLGDRGDKAGAEAAYRAAIAADPQYANAHNGLGAALATRGDMAGAARLFAAALKIDPSDATAKANLQLALRMLKEEHQHQG